MIPHMSRNHHEDFDEGDGGPGVLAVDDGGEVAIEDFDEGGNAKEGKGNAANGEPVGRALDGDGYAFNRREPVSQGLGGEAAGFAEGKWKRGSGIWD